MTTPVGRIYATWTDPSGEEWPLTDLSPERGYHTTRGIAGWGAMPYEIIVDPMARGGESVRHIRTNPARITWPLNIWGDTHMEFVERYRAIKRAIMMTVHRGAPGRLTVMRPDGTGRFVEAFYESGFSGEAGENWVHANPVLTLYCPDGSWKSTTAEIEERSLGSEAPVSFLNPFFTLSPGALGGSSTIDNPGDLIAWPLWTITGPATGFTATNTTTGKSFSINYTLAATQTITMTTERPTVRGPAGENLVDSLDWPTAYLWGLEPGVNDVTFSVGGAGLGTKVVIEYYPRYDGA